MDEDLAADLQRAHLSGAPAPPQQALPSADASGESDGGPSFALHSRRLTWPAGKTYHCTPSPSHLSLSPENGAIQPALQVMVLLKLATPVQMPLRVLIRLLV